MNRFNILSKNKQTAQGYKKIPLKDDMIRIGVSLTLKIIERYI
jgi:hypothetical protein